MCDEIHSSVPTEKLHQNNYDEIQLPVIRLFFTVIGYLAMSVAVADSTLIDGRYNQKIFRQFERSSQTFQVAMNGDNDIQKMDLTFSIDGKKQQYILYSPTSYQADQQYPLLIVVQGVNSKPHRFIRSTGFAELADQYGILVAFVQPEDNDGWERIIAAKNNTYSANYIRALLTTIAARKNVRRDQIYLTGFSLGGMLVLSAMCELYDTVAAFAVVSASLPKQLKTSCAVQKAVPAIIIASRDDPYIPWNGGKFAYDMNGITDLQLLSIFDTSELWRTANGCDARPLIEPLTNLDATDGTTVTRLAYDFKCVSNAPVLVYAITGGGHSWPGSRYKLRSFEGSISRDLDATKVIWNFFNQGKKK